MSSQVALHPELKNPFEFADARLLDSAMVRRLQDSFENGKVLVVENLSLEAADFFMDHPGRWYPSWIPPLTSEQVFASNCNPHPLESICNGATDIEDFQKSARVLESSWLSLAQRMFGTYSWKSYWFSYRFNHMALGRLHLDVPEETYEEHQLRFFVNFDREPRILTIGPTIFELAKMFWKEFRIDEIRHLPNHLFIGEFRKRILDDTTFKFQDLPRHYLTLNPGAGWVSHSSYISHGLIFGRKTACMEIYLRPETMLTPSKSFSNQLRRLKQNGPEMAEL